MLRSVFLIVLLLLLIQAPSRADVRLPKIFGDHMVIQREKEIVVWGWADPKEKVSVQFNRQTKSTTASKTGEWRVVLNAEAAGGPYELIVKGKNSISVRDVMIGEVWLCSGQSNMEWTIANSLNPSEEIRNAQYPLIRHFKVPNEIASEPRKDISSGAWQVCSPETAANFTAVGYFFAREILKEMNVPIGLINSSWGGTHSETWTSREAFQNSDEFKAMISRLPRLNLDSLAKVREEQTLKRLQESQGALPKSKSEATGWANFEYDDSRWRRMNVPGLWEGQELGDIDGVVWLRRTFEVPVTEVNKSASVELAMIDDSDEVFVNGKKIGSTQSKWNEKRVYPIGNGILRGGRNVIAIRVEDTGGGGGIHGEGKDMVVRMGTLAIPLSGSWAYQVESLSKGPGAVGPNSYPTLLFNSMIHPLLPLKIRGAIWYQGESNAGRSFQYRKAFPLMISDWRKQFNQGDFPFYFVQLATFGANHGTSETGSGWAELREAQSMTLALPNTGMAVTVDIGDPGDIHPKNKQDVGKRLAAIALSRTYGKTRVDGGPVYKSMEVKADRVELTFENIGGGMLAKDKYGYVRGFEIAGMDKKFHYAKASVEGNKIIVYSDKVKEPAAVRYGWADDASDCNLYNAEGFPASPFRTDNWRGVTEESKFQF